MESQLIGLQSCILNWSRNESDRISVKKILLREQPKENQKGCMPFYHSPKSYVSEAVSIRRNIIIKEEEISQTTSRGQKKKK
jgi:hypothetical protein